MVDLIRFKYVDQIKDEVNMQYVNSEGRIITFLNNISKVNIFIGKNNSGKSRFMRAIIKNKYDFIDVYSSDLTKNGQFERFINTYRNTSIMEIQKYIKILVKYKDMKKTEILSVLLKMHDEIRNISDPYVIRDCFGYLEKLIAFLNKETIDIVYIPILRGIEKFSNTTKDFSTGDDSFKLTEGERKDLKAYISQVDRVYYNKVLNNYFQQNNNFSNIHTGELMYGEIQKKLLGTESERSQIKEYEEFLSKNFFENKRISLIPNISTGYLYINIDGEEHELHNFGEGIKQLILITYSMFVNKNKKMLFFIEEPELNLHPGLQRKLIELMLSNEFENQQYFITTHSNHLIDLSLDYNNMSIFKFEKLKNNKIKISKCSRDDNKILQLIGAKPSSVFNSNCTVWIEGITDRLFIRKYLELYQKKLIAEGKLNREFREDIDYSFVEYSGGNITHWSFVDSIDKSKINAEFLSRNILVIADNDFPKEKSEKAMRLKKLKEQLGDHFYKLPVREVENLLTRDVLLKIVKKREKDDNVYFKPDINCETKKYIEGYIGKILDECVQVPEGVGKHKYTYSESKSLYDKVDFCNIAIECLKTFEDLSDNAKELTELVFEFIEKNNTEY